MLAKELKIAFFGTPEIAQVILAELHEAGYTPSLIVTNPDAPVGRKQILTQSPAALWGEEHAVTTIKPHSLKDKSGADITPLTTTEWDVFVVAAYGKIIPSWLLSLPKYGTLNVHPSLLPKLRGASPIRSGLLTDLSAIGVTIMLMDEELDHGPIIAQKPYPLTEPIKGCELDMILAHEGGKLLSDTITTWVASQEHSIVEQDHTKATFCGKITKEMGKLDIDPFNLPTAQQAQLLYRKICAFDGWPGTFFFYNNKRIKIIDAFVDRSGSLVITTVVPEGKKEMSWDQWLASIH